MKTLSFIQRLTRDLTQTNPSNLTAEERQTILDCVNASLQIMHDHAPDHSKVTTISINLAAPQAITIGVVQGSTDFTSYSATDEDMYCTIKITGDKIDNQIIGNDKLLLPYSGATGTVSATIYYDAVALPAQYSSISSNPRYADTNTELLQGAYPARDRLLYRFAVGSPECWSVEPNGQHDDYRAVFRVDRLPISAIRLKATARLAPPRITFLDTITATRDLPIRYEHVESYLLPMVRGLLAETDLWRSESLRSAAVARGNAAEVRYSTMIPQTLTTPSNSVGSPSGY
jgi:hypothetical protein